MHQNAKTVALLLLWSSVLSLSPRTPALAQGGPPPHVREAVDAIVAVLEASDAASRDQFIDDKLAPLLIEASSRTAYVAAINEMRQTTQGADGISIELVDDGLQLIFEGQQRTVIGFRVADQPPHHITQFVLLDVSVGPPPLRTPTSQAEAEEIRAMALEQLAFLTDDADLLAFAETHLTPSFRERRTESSFLALLRKIRQTAASAGGVELNRMEYGMVIGFRGPHNVDVVFDVQAVAPFQISSLQVVEVAPEQRTVTPLSWESLESHIEDAVGNGFSGTVLIVRDGEPVLHQGYGFANRATQRPNTTETLFDIGSTPIFFTQAAVLLLAQQGDLSLDDRIATFFENVPADKATMTVRHLMESTSGLPNFHHRTGVDADYDLTYIDRDKAVRRILEQPLLFAPGEDTAHSHSAWTFLAALVEIVSGQSYIDFLRTHFFEPANMTRTALYGPNPAFAVTDMATGYGSSRVGPDNVPLQWGPTSWLIMGSGGMVSTPHDLFRWVRFIEGGNVLTGSYLNQYRRSERVMGGSDRGFFFGYAKGQGRSVFASTNSHDRQGDVSEQLILDLLAFAQQE